MDDDFDDFDGGDLPVGPLAPLGYGGGRVRASGGAVPPPAGPPPPPGPAKYPRPPAPHYGSYTADAVIRACERVRRGGSPQAALRAEGVRLTLETLTRRAADAEAHPFFAWALECLELADAEALLKMEERLAERAEDGDVKALTFALKARSPIYRTPDEGGGSGPAGGLKVTYEDLRRLLTADPSALGGLGRAGYAVPAPAPAEESPPAAPAAAPPPPEASDGPRIRRRPPRPLDDD